MGWKTAGIAASKDGSYRSPAPADGRNGAKTTQRVKKRTVFLAKIEYSDTREMLLKDRAVCNNFVQKH